MHDASFFRQVSETLGCDPGRAEAVTFVVFQELRDRLPPKEAADVAAQLPTGLKRLWRAEGRPGWPVLKVHAHEFMERIRHFAVLHDDREAEQAVRAVFAALKRLLGSPRGTEGEAWDVFSVLPKDLKMLWLAAGQSTAH